jgi:hypothetical protein
MSQKQDKHAIYQRAQLGHTLGYGKRPAIVVVDFQRLRPQTLAAGRSLDAEVAATSKLITAARKKNVPVILRS